MVNTALEQVLGNTDLLTQILVLVLAKPLITFKTVSKFWSALISSRLFQIAHTHHHPPSLLCGFYYQNPRSFDIKPISFLGSPSSIPKMPLENVGQSAPTKSTEITILDSCNGLFLCFNPEKRVLSVLNPTTGDYRLLPEPFNPLKNGSMLYYFLAFDPSKPCHYKVVNLKNFGRNLGQSDEQFVTFVIFSSENESYEEANFLVPSDWKFCHTRLVFWIGAINLISEENLHIRFMVEEKKLASFNICGQGKVAYFGECGHSLHLVKFREKGAWHFNVFEMNKVSNSWAPKCQLNLGPLVSTFLEMSSPYIQGRLRYSVLSVERETIKDNFSFALGIPGKILIYWMDKDANLTIVKVLGEFEDNLCLKSYIDLHPFIQCLAPVSSERLT